MTKTITVENSRNWGVFEVLTYENRKMKLVLDVMVPWKHGVFSFELNTNFEKLLENYRYNFPISQMREFYVELLDNAERPEFKIKTHMREDKKQVIENFIESQWWKYGSSFFKLNGWKLKKKKYHIYDGFSKYSHIDENENLMCA